MWSSVRLALSIRIAPALRNLPCKRVQCDEIWSFVGAKQKNVPVEREGEFGVGDVWTWTAICADTKIIASWMWVIVVPPLQTPFIADLAGRLANCIQLTTDGHKVYVDAVERAFGAAIYAMLIKVYGESQPSPERKYSPSEHLGNKIVRIEGQPDPAHISTAMSSART